MIRTFAEIFVDHPRSVDETNFEHMRFAGWVAVRLMRAGDAALVHAFIHRMFEHTASLAIAQMHGQLARRS